MSQEKSYFISPFEILVELGLVLFIQTQHSHGDHVVTRRHHSAFLCNFQTDFRRMMQPSTSKLNPVASGPKIQFLSVQTEGILTPRANPVCATEDRFCPTENGHLILKRRNKRNFECTSVSPFNFTASVNVPSNKWKFILQEKELSFNTNEGVASIFSIRRKLLTVSDQYALLKKPYSVGNLPTEEGKDPKLIELVRFTNFCVPTRNKCKIIAEFLDANKKTKKRMLMLKGDFDMNSLTLYMGDPKKEGERIVAKIRKLESGKSGKEGKCNESWRIDFAGGFDVVVILGLFVVLDDVQIKNPQAKTVPALLK